ncbi:peroxisomal membrane protein pex16 [Ophiostoma piceae UAMH 11346]|uniref:Peroxisomal membrane protein PEX16 n=1 Tax=Ophiostoma piceae (strain UAMH 11346) TaxID=1262450 RepID=S3C085_OPHP1|nr:peroxisomal membrane protein pex16 [Ophiostoma piceae UAMH 11346]
MTSTRVALAGPSGSGSHRSPTKWLSAYDDFITKNLGQVSQIESTLRSLTYIIPGRFRDAEIASEAIHSGVQLLSLYHDLLLLRTSSAVGGAATTPASPSSSSTHNTAPSSISSKPPLGPAHPPDQHTRYTRYWTYKSPFYRRVAIVLQVVRYTEMLCEMAAKRRGERIRWRVVVIIEAIKALCQLLLLRITRGRTLVTPVLPVRQPLPEPDEDEQEDEEDEADEEYEAEDETAINRHHHIDAFDEAAVPSEGNDSKPNTSLISPHPPLSPPPSPLRTPAEPVASANLPPSPPPTERQSTPSHHSSPYSHTKGWSMPRTGMSLPPLPQPGDISSYLLSRVLTADDIKPATKLLNQLRGSAQVAEILHILTPLVFAIALARTREKRRTSWTPWLAGLAMECAARQLRDHSLRTTTLEREEWTRRGWSMGWWSMRGAFYEHLTKGVVGGVRARLPNFIGGIVEDYEYLWENYYFSTSP